MLLTACFVLVLITWRLLASTTDQKLVSLVTRSSVTDACKRTKIIRVLNAIALISQLVGYPLHSLMYYRVAQKTGPPSHCIRNSMAELRGNW